jgi:hypothetical protein
VSIHFVTIRFLILNLGMYRSSISIKWQWRNNLKKNMIMEVCKDILIMKVEMPSTLINC